MSRRTAYTGLALVCAIPRLGVLLRERDAILGSYTEKSDIFAQTFVHNGTFGFLPGEPSAYTQPLYGWFLVPVYWIFGRHWWSIGLAQIVVAVATALLVYEIGRRVLSPRAGLIGAAIATLNPYLIWHDVHVNREIVDQVCAAALVLLTLIAAERPSKRIAVALGVVTGLAILGNTRLVFVPILCALYLLWRIPRAAALAALVLVGAAVAVAPWLIRNKVNVGCWAITTDARALWKANNPQTHRLLSSGRWIDDLERPFFRPQPPNYYTPEDAWGYYEKGRPDLAYRFYPGECRQMSVFQDRAIDWATDHPSDKLSLALLSMRLLWQPSVIETSGRSGAGSHLDVGRRVVEPAYMIALFALGFVGLFLVPRYFAALALLLLAYQTVCAAVFVGATRYRVAWDFLIAILAAAAIERVAARRR